MAGPKRPMRMPYKLLRSETPRMPRTCVRDMSRAGAMACISNPTPHRTSGDAGHEHGWRGGQAEARHAHALAGQARHQRRRQQRPRDARVPPHLLVAQDSNALKVF